jgi:hypothetical protein
MNKMRNKKTGIVYFVIEEGLGFILNPVRKCHAVLTMNKHSLKLNFEAVR